MAALDLEVVARQICNERQMLFVKRVGEGAFKETFQVLRPDGSPVALKLYKSAVSSAREQREISAMLRCDHSNIAKLLSVDDYDYAGTHLVILVEEFLEGGSLTHKGTLTTDECFAIGASLIDAIGHTGSLGLVHRDIKPDNIMFRKDGVTPVLTDFGVARDLLESSLTPTWAPRGPGTPFFSSPEQLNNQKNLTDWRSDQFALGLVLGYVTLGLHAYQAPSTPDYVVVELMTRRQGPTGYFVKAAQSVGLPVLEKMVAPWPVLRYRTARELADAWRQQRGKN